jgi:hypothetical protein
MGGRAAKGGDPDMSKMTPDEQETFAACFQGSHGRNKAVKSD